MQLPLRGNELILPEDDRAPVTSDYVYLQIAKEWVDISFVVDGWGTDPTVAKKLRER